MPCEELNSPGIKILEKSCDKMSEVTGPKTSGVGAQLLSSCTSACYAPEPLAVSRASCPGKLLLASSRRLRDDSVAFLGNCVSLACAPLCRVLLHAGLVSHSMGQTLLPWLDSCSVNLQVTAKALFAEVRQQVGKKRPGGFY